MKNTGARGAYKLLTGSEPEIEEKETGKDNFLWIILSSLFILLAIVLQGCGAFASENIDLRVIATIESSNNELAYNNKSGAVGLYQITPICLKDYNFFHKPQLTMEDMYLPQNAYKVADWYLNHRIPSLLQHYGLKDTIVRRLWAYNSGIGLVKNGIMPKETKDYINKYNKLTRRI